MQRKIIQTADGSSSLFVPELDEHYHSIHGAIQESMYVFIEAGLKHTQKPSIKIFEMGYGTGLNFILSILHAGSKKIEYHGVEAFPLTFETIQQLNYPEQLKLSSSLKETYLNFHKTIQKTNLSDKLTICKSNCLLKEYNPSTSFDLIYFDAFTPEVQPELWGKEVFQKMYNMLNPDGILTTYCAKGVVRRTMIDCGFQVERLPGPPEKRHILRATKKI